MLNIKFTMISDLFRPTVTNFINKILKKMGFRIIRSTSFERFLVTQAHYAELVAEKNNIALGTLQMKDDHQLEARIAELELRSKEQPLKNVIRYMMKAHWRTIDLIEQISGSNIPTQCALCGHQFNHHDFEPIAAECVFWGGQLLRHRCLACGVIFGPQKIFQLDSEMLDLDYRNLYEVYSEGNTTDSIIRTFHLLAPKKEGIYLDFGCGGTWSEAIMQLRQQGWNLYGFEPSVTHSSEFVFSKWEEIETMQFDGILTHNVLEHLLDPSGTTKRLGSLLSPDGRLIHTTACFEYRYEFSHYHVFFFTGRAPEVLAQQSGMRIIDWIRDGDFIACIMKKN